MFGCSTRSRMTAVAAPPFEDIATPPVLYLLYLLLLYRPGSSCNSAPPTWKAVLLPDLWAVVPWYHGDLERWQGAAGYIDEQLMLDAPEHDDS